MGCQNGKSNKTSPSDFYYQTSQIFRLYLSIDTKLRAHRQAIFEATQKDDLLHSQDTTFYQDSQTISEIIFRLKLDKEGAEFIAIQQEFNQFLSSQNALLHEFKETAIQHKILLRQIRSKQSYAVEQMIAKMEKMRNKLYSYYKISSLTEETDEEKNRIFFPTFSSTLHSTKEEF